jgi:hypothetical protein
MPSPMKLEKDRSTVNPTSTSAPRKRVSYRKFEKEKNAKNEAYFFILSHNLLNEFAEFCNNYHSDDPHKDCMEFLLSNI